MSVQIGDSTHDVAASPESQSPVALLRDVPVLPFSSCRRVALLLVSPLACVPTSALLIRCASCSTKRQDVPVSALTSSKHMLASMVAAARGAFIFIVAKDTCSKKEKSPSVHVKLIAGYAAPSWPVERRALRCCMGERVRGVRKYRRLRQHSPAPSSVRLSISLPSPGRRSVRRASSQSRSHAHASLARRTRAGKPGCRGAPSFARLFVACHDSVGALVGGGARGTDGPERRKGRTWGKDGAASACLRVTTESINQ